MVQEAERAAAGPPTSEQGQAHAQLRYAENEVASSRQEASSARQARDDALQQLETLRHELGQAQQQQQAQEQLDGNAEAVRLRQEMATLQEKMGTMEEERLRQQQQAQDALAAAQQDLDQKTLQAVTQSKHVDDLGAATAAAAATAQQQHDAQVQTLTADLAAAQSAREEALARLQAAKDQLDESQQDADRLSAANEEQEAQLADLKRQVHLLRTGKGPAARRDSVMATSPGDPDQRDVEPAPAQDANVARSGMVPPCPDQTDLSACRSKGQPGSLSFLHG